MDLNTEIVIGLLALTTIGFGFFILGTFVLKLLGDVDPTRASQLIKKSILKYLKSVMYIMVVYLLIIALDILSMVEINRYNVRGYPSILYFFTQNMLFVFTVSIIVPYFLVKNMRLWRKFE